MTRLTRGQAIDFPPLKVIQRFFALVQEHGIRAADGHSRCWQWMGTINADGYGHLQVGLGKKGKTKTYKAHRLAYAIFNDGLPETLDVHHTCRNKWCVNPDHLEAISRETNVVDGNKHRRETEVSRVVPF